MESERRAFEVFLALHAHNARPTSVPTAHLHFYSEGQTDGTLVAFTREEVIEELDREAELVRFLLHQMTTYDCTRQRIVGLVFSKHTVLSDVLRMPEDAV